MASRIVKDRASSSKRVGSNSGRSISNEFPQGQRRKQNGNLLAPHSLRAKGKVYLSECTTSELEKIGLA